MISTLNFVRGAVATKDLIPVLTHLLCYDGRLQGSNGKITIDAPCADLLGYNFTVPCAAFLKAIDACQNEPRLVVSSDKATLTIQQKKFKATLSLLPDGEFPRQAPVGVDGSLIGGSLLPTLKALSTFISQDASRPWACGILFRGGMAFATNNIVVAGAPAVSFNESLNLPGFLVDELLRLNQEPSRIVACENSITFTFPNGAWIKSSLLSSEWPAVENMLPGETQLGCVSPGLLQAVESIVPFCPDPKQPLIYFGPDGVKTAGGDKCAHVEGFDLSEAIFRAEPLCQVLKSASHADFSTYPKPIPWTGPNGLKGLLVGVKV